MMKIIKPKKLLKYLAILILIIVIAIVLIYTLLQLLTKPLNDRKWVKEMTELSSASTNGDIVTLNNVRNNNYRTTSDFDVNYYQAQYNIKDLKKGYLITDPFGKLSAHTMLGFEFENGQKVVLSVEIRREEGETFENMKGLLNGYELYYVWADENDVIKLRTNYRLDNVYLYELKMSEENIQKLFTEALLRTNELKNKPEFYNLITNNCTTNLAQMLQRVYNKKIIVDWRYLVPAYAEGLSIKYDLIDGKDIEEIRKTHNISSLAKECGDCKSYSESIRKILTK